MQRTVLILEAINAVLGIGTNALSGGRVFGLPVGYLNSVFFALFFLGFLFLYLNENKIKAEIRDSVLAEIKSGMVGVAEKIGTLDSVTSQDRLLIQAMAFDMAIAHGHLDFDGLLADRASGVPLNELKRRPCSVCGISRDTKSNKWGKGDEDEL